MTRRKAEKCQRWRASGLARAPAGARYSGRVMSSFFVFRYNIERFMPRRALSLGSAHHPASLAQGTENLLPLGVGQRKVGPLCGQLCTTVVVSFLPVGVGQYGRIVLTSDCSPLTPDLRPQSRQAVPEATGRGRE